ncbi:Phosphodiesterase [Aphelenchoides besseyi]|nr:Phosphodiesterase [Aphelenchoides besseyi]KAI6210407.1 Phosphodiesterase [Aphelenchoides besseyi]
MSATSVQVQPELNADHVIDYLITHPNMLESFVTGPHISRETFQRWSLKRTNRLRKDSRRQLLSIYTTPTGRQQARRALLEVAHDTNRILYELALTCAQIAQVDHFELLVRVDGHGEVASEPEWMNVVPGDEPKTIKLRKSKRNRKPAVHVQKLIDYNELLLAEIHFFSVVNDRDAQYLNVLCTWACSMIHFAGLATRREPITPLFSPTPEDVEYVNRTRKLNGFLLNVLRSIFQEMNTMDIVILKIMNFAQKLVDADRASLFLVDAKAGEIHAQIFDVGQDATNGKESIESGQPKETTRKEIKFPLGKGIAGCVAQTGKGLNIPNAYEDERFNRDVDLQTGYHTNTILCMPIFMRGNVIGVVQMVNKHNGEFTSADEESFETFAIYCGLALHHAKLYDKIRRSEQKYRVALEVLAYHSVCNRDEVNKLKRVQLQNYIPELDHFEFNGNKLSELEKPLYAVYMFRTLFSDFLRFDHDDLIRFTLTVRKNYRKVPYHNWQHGFTVAHAMFVFLRQTKIFQPLEALALYVASICHDLDHRGKNNAYMKSMSTPLASIYSTSVMEHHHFNQTVTILQQDGHNILRSLRGDEYKQVLSLIKHCILATDLALFFPNRAQMAGLCERNEFSWTNESHRLLSQAIIMTSCDLIATAKPWKIQTETVKVIFEEFYEQGDAEKLNGREPIPMMDRSKANELPQMQVGFMKGICCPCYDVIAKVIPQAEQLKERAAYNLAKWEELAEEQRQLQSEEEARKNS